MEFLYARLQSFDAEAAIHGDNPLGWALAALMKIPTGRAAELGAEALRKIAEARLDDSARHLLAECVQAYLPLGPEGLVELRRATEAPAYKGVQAMNLTWTEIARAEGETKGKIAGNTEGKIEVLQTLLETRFGALPKAATDLLATMADRELLGLSKKLLSASSLAELGLAPARRKS